MIHSQDASGGGIAWADTALDLTDIKVKDSLMSVLDAVNTTDTLQALYKETLNTALEHMWSGDSGWAEADLARLRDIAMLCPHVHGSGVYHARAMLSYMDTLQTLYLNQCELPFEPEERRGAPEPTVDEQSPVMIYPNPTEGTIFVTCTLPEGEKARISLLDCLGREQWYGTTDCAGSAHALNGLADGVYLCLISINGKVVHVQKIVLAPHD